MLQVVQVQQYCLEQTPWRASDLSLSLAPIELGGEQGEDKSGWEVPEGPWQQRHVAAAEVSQEGVQPVPTLHLRRLQRPQHYHRVLPCTHTCTGQTDVCRQPSSCTLHMHQHMHRHDPRGTIICTGQTDVCRQPFSRTLHVHRHDPCCMNFLTTFTTTAGVTPQCQTCCRT